MSISAEQDQIMRDRATSGGKIIPITTLIGTMYRCADCPYEADTWRKVLGHRKAHAKSKSKDIVDTIRLILDQPTRQAPTKVAPSQSKAYQRTYQKYMYWKRQAEAEKQARLKTEADLEIAIQTIRYLSHGPR